jgi:hypothetical protein
MFELWRQGVCLDRPRYSSDPSVRGINHAAGQSTILSPLLGRLRKFRAGSIIFRITLICSASDVILILLPSQHPSARGKSNKGAHQHDGQVHPDTW